MYALVVQCFNKPDTLALTLNSLVKCHNRGDFDLIIWQDSATGSERQDRYEKACQATRALIESTLPHLKREFRSVDFKANHSNLGCYKTCQIAIDYAFESHSHVIFSEDDAVFAEDALVWFKGMFQSEAIKDSRCVAIAAESPYFNADEKDVPRDLRLDIIVGINKTDVGARFLPFNWVPSTVFGVNRDQWARIRDIRGLVNGDVVLCEHCREQDLHCLFPIVPRAKDVGMLHGNGYSVGIHGENNVPPKNVFVTSDDLVQTDVEYKLFIGRQGPIYALTSKLLREEGSFETLYALEPES